MNMISIHYSKLLLNQMYPNNEVPFLLTKIIYSLNVSFLDHLKVYNVDTSKSFHKIPILSCP